MIGIIIAGGSGSRLWPLSTPDYPKHLLKLTNANSLIQNTVLRTEKLADKKSIVIITEASHGQHVKEQIDLPKENIIAEPARRGNANSVLLALRYLKKNNYDPDEPIAVLWADHLIRDTRGFVSSLKRAGELACKYQKVVYIGAEPLYASTGFGYMEHGPSFDHEPQTYELISFHEKPDYKVAKKYFSSGHYFWNMGYMVATLNTIEREAKKYSPEYWKSFEKLLNAKDYEAEFLKLENKALDYVFSERIKDALVIPGNFDWTDIGSFGDLHKISPQDESGNHVRGNNVELDKVTNSYVRNDSDKPIAVIGVDNIVIVNSPNGLLITNKNFAQNVGEISKKFNKSEK